MLKVNVRELRRGGHFSTAYDEIVLGKGYSSKFSDASVSVVDQKWLKLEYNP